MRMRTQGSLYDGSTRSAGGDINGTMTGPLILRGDPVDTLEAATKNYVDSKFVNMDASQIKTGTLSISTLPAMTGDITKPSGSNVITLNPTGVTAGTYPKVGVDSKGRVISGSVLSEADLPAMDFSKVNSGRPTTLSGYGITDGVRLSGDTLTGPLVLASNPVVSTDAATKGYLESVIATIPSGISTGDVIRKTTTVTPAGYLRCNGGQVSQTTYSALYAVIGKTYNITLQPGSGQPWKQQYAFNISQSTDISGWTTVLPLPAAIANSRAIVTSSRVYLIGGYNGSSYISTVYTAPVNSDGTLGTWGTGPSLPLGISNPGVIVANSRVYLFGGSSLSNGSLTTIYSAVINSDGTLGTWNSSGSMPQGRTNMEVIVTASRVYLIGGESSGAFIANVYSGIINADGSIGNWVEGFALSGGIKNSQTVVTSSRVYLLGGHNGSASFSTVYVATINADGTLGAWTTSNSLPGVLSQSQVVVTSSRVYLLGGYNSNSYTSIVYTAPINADGTLGTWTTGTSLPFGIGLSQVVTTSSKVYLLGGIVTGSYTAAVREAPFSGGLSDYSGYYSGSYMSTSAGNFRLPDLTSVDLPGSYSYIKV